jgi:arginine repressor
MRNKQEKFVEIAEKRVSRLLKDIRLIGNLSNRNNYIYDANDVAKIFGAIQAELTISRKRFDVALTSQEKSFKLR